MLEQIRLRNKFGATFSGPLERQVFAPGNNPLIEKVRDGGGPHAKPAQTNQAQGAPGQGPAHAGLPFTFAGRPVLLRQAADHGLDQGPDHFHRGFGAAQGTADDDAVLRRRRHIDGTVAHARGDQQFQVRQFFEQDAGKGRPLPHGGQDFKWRQAFGHCAQVSQIVIENSDFHISWQARPIRQLQRYPLIVIQDCQLGRHVPASPFVFAAFARNFCDAGINSRLANIFMNSSPDCFARLSAMGHSAYIALPAAVLP